MTLQWLILALVAMVAYDARPKLPYKLMVWIALAGATLSLVGWWPL